MEEYEPNMSFLNGGGLVEHAWGRKSYLDAYYHVYTETQLSCTN